MAATTPPPVMEARRWADGLRFDADRPLLNLSQAAPVAPPPEPLRQEMAQLVLDHPEVHLYGPVLGLPDLRAEIADRWSRDYGGAIAPAQVAVTSGCNEAFCAVLATLAGPGEAVALPVPWYFNHKMALDMGGQRAVPLATGDDLLPDPDHAARTLPRDVRAIVLVTPNNPGGVEYPPALLAAFRDLARDRGAALVVDETYRDFHSRPGAPHDLFTDPGWDETLIQLYSFSKAYRLTGHRVGAIAASPARLAEVEKYLDTVTICPAQLGQHAALWGMRHLSDWLAGERAEILARGAAARAAIGRLDGWRIRGCGAYFAYVEHPFAMSSADLAPHLVREAGVLLLPGTMFRPRDSAAGDAGGDTTGVDTTGGRELRIAFANADATGIETLADRLAGIDLPRR